MTKQQTFMPTRRFEFPLTYLTTGMWYQPWVQWWILYFSTVTVIPTGSFRPFVFKPTFWTTRKKKRKEKESHYFSLFQFPKIVTRLLIKFFTTDL